MKLSVSAYRAHASAHKKILSSSYQTQFNYGSTAAASISSTSTGLFSMEPTDAQVTSTTNPLCPSGIITNNSSNANSGAGGGGGIGTTGSATNAQAHGTAQNVSSPAENLLSPTTTSAMTSRDEDEDSSNQVSSDCKSPGQRSSSHLFAPSTSFASNSSLEIIMENDNILSQYRKSREMMLLKRRLSTISSHRGTHHNYSNLYNHRHHPRSQSSINEDDNDNDDNKGDCGTKPCKTINGKRLNQTNIIVNNFDDDDDDEADEIEDDDDDDDDVDMEKITKILNKGDSCNIPGSSSAPNTSKGSQSWKNVRAVMAYYYALRKIKRTKSNQRWMKLRTTVQLSSAIQKKPPLKREDSFLKRFSTRQIPETQETVEDTGSEGASGDHEKSSSKRRMRYNQKRKTVVNPDENFYFYWLMVLTICVLYNLWTLIVRQSFPELQEAATTFWFTCDCMSDIVFLCDVAVQLRTGYLEQGLMVYNGKKLACHYMRSREFTLDLAALIPLDILQFRFGTQPLLRFPRFFKVYRSVKFYYIVESRTVWPNLWRVVNLIHILLILAHWFGCFYFLLSEVEGFQGDWVYPYRPGDYATLTRKYLGSLYWSTLTLTTIGDLPTPETNAEPSSSADGPRSLPRRGLKSRLLQFASNYGYIFTIVSYLIGVFIFATIVGQVGNVITNRNANRLEFERLLDGAKTYMRHHKVPGGMKRRVLRWYDYSWSRGRIQGGGDINTALGLLPDKLKTELALHVNLSVLKKVTIFQECQPEFLHDLVLKMKAYIFTPGDSICRKGEVAREMFIIADGILEVLSETGKVLTIMKAGDFFGEIGILNLDGLNKRTADVRSVGYSELFSLSREDVLAAMKDYPEAQEILQTLGRKRLMEVRCVNKRHAKQQSDKEHALLQQQGAQGDNSSDNSASKRIVDKLKSDVKGIKNVLRKSRTNRRSNESIELQPLHIGAASSSSSSNKTPKGVLRRMPRVRSDELNGDGDENINHHHHQYHHYHHDSEQKSPSPIGAGLPLLSRLRLLKEKQDREERAVKSAPPVITPPNTHVTSAMSPQESIQEEPEPEVIGAGLPLLQRLKLLKAKEEKQTKEPPPQAKLQVITSQSSSSPSVAQSLSPTSPTVKTVNLLSVTATTSSIPSPLAKPLKVSFKDRIKNLQAGVTQSTVADAKDTSSHEAAGDSMKEQLLPTVTAKPAKTISLKDKIKALSQPKVELDLAQLSSSPSTSLKPWSKLKLATVVSSGGSYTSLTNSVCEDSPTGTQTFPTTSTKTMPSPLQVTTTYSPIPHTLKALLPLIPLHKTTDDISINNQTDTKLKLVEKETSDAASVSDSEIKPTKKLSPFHRSAKRHQKVESASSSSDTTKKRSIENLVKLASGFKLKPRPYKVSSEQIPTTSDGTPAKGRRTKSYRSVDDLSPEYGGLPFVKKLKILNERQKLAELESVIQTRSFSLDCTDSGNNLMPENLEPLTRSHSEASAMGRNNNNTNTTKQCLNSSTTGTAAAKALTTLTKSSNFPLPIVIPIPTQLPLSPESNETLERRQLKSILKKLSEDKLTGRIPSSGSSMTATTNNSVTCVTATTTTTSTINKHLMREPTLEGYVARHSKLLKSVTFNSTLSSPPNSANLCESIEDRSLFPFLSAQPIDDQPQMVNDDNNNNDAGDHPAFHTAISVNIQMEETLDDARTKAPSSTSPPPPPPDTISSSETLIDQDEVDRINEFNNRNCSKLEGDTKTTINNNFLKSVQNQKMILKGSIEEQEYFGEVLLGIKQVIQNHLREVQGKFQERFHDLESEVKRRDDIISQLQSRIQELEGHHSERSLMTKIEEVEREKLGSSGTGSTGSSLELPFMRGDSLDTIFASSPPSDSGRPRSKCRNRKRSPRHRDRSDSINRSWEESSDQESVERQDLPRSISPYRGMLVADITGNLRAADSVVLNMDDDEEEEEDEEHSSSTSSCDSQLDDDPGELHCDDWEIKMLAAELDRRESKKDELTSETISEGDEQGGLLRRRRKRSDTDTECSEIEAELLTRPRAASLDQHNPRRTTPKLRGVFKAMSFDRDKDRL